MGRIRKQYHFRESPGGFYAWDVGRLIKLSSDLEIREIALSEIGEIDENYWFDSGSDVPTCRRIIDHMHLINKADLAFPIILCPNLRIMDGMHRVAKALLQNRASIPAVTFTKLPQPDFVDVHPDELPY